jgi:putative ABC transport system permease protein
MRAANLVRFAARLLARDFRAGELRVLAVALLVAVAAVTSVAFFADRVKQTLNREAHQLLGGDLMLVSHHPWAPGIAEEIRRRGLRGTSSVAFISVVQAGEANQLAGVKAVARGYPLRGTMRVAPGTNQPDTAANDIPGRGEIWLDERLTSALAAGVGSTITLGEASFKVGAVLTLEPERGASFFNIAPRLMMSAEDLPATGLIQPGSRIHYRLYAAGEPGRVAEFARWIEPQLERGQRIETLENARPEVRVMLERGEQFLGLTAALAVVLAGIAIALAARRFVERHLDGLAVMRCLGASQTTLLSAHLLEFVLLAAVVVSAGCAAGWLAHQGLAYWLAQYVGAELPPASVLPALQGFLVGAALLAGFAAPPLMQVKNVPAVRVIRRESGPPRVSAVLTYGAGLSAAAALLLWQAGDAKLGAAVIGGFAGAGAAFVILGWLMVRAIGVLARIPGIALRYGVASLRRRSPSSALQIASLTVGLTAILLLTVTRADLFSAWRRAAPADAPNRFVFNIQPGQLAPVNEYFREHGIAPPKDYPMVRGRLTAVNGRPVIAGDYEGERGKRLVEREFNLSWMVDLPRHNEIVAGAWWGAKPGAEFSVEEGIARTLGLALGDTLTYTVAGEALTGRITSLRKLQWDSMQVNFFVIAPPGLLARYPASYITSFRVAPEQEPALNQFARRFPNLTVVDVSAILRQFQAMLDKVVAAVQFVFLFALGAGLIVLYAALGATEDERRRESALLRALGARTQQVRAAHRVEFLVMGLAAGTLGAFAALAIGQVLAFKVFRLNVEPNYWLALLGPAAGMFLVMLNARIGLRASLTTPPSVALRESA